MTKALTLPAGPLAIAHRGGAGLPANAGIENSLRAVQHAVDLGYSYIETDVHATNDGVPFVLHDADLERVAGKAVQVAEVSAAELRAITLSGGESIPSLAELLEEFSGLRFNIDLKSDTVVSPAVAVLEAAQATGRVLLAAFSHARLARVRRLLPRVATSASPKEIAALRFGRLPLAARAGAIALQIPVTTRVWGRPVRLVTDALIARAHDQRLQVHVWTIDDPDSMAELLDRGVDGIVSDRIDVLREVLMARGDWPAPGEWS